MLDDEKQRVLKQLFAPSLGKTIPMKISAAAVFQLAMEPLGPKLNAADRSYLENTLRAYGDLRVAEVQKEDVHAE